MLLSSELTYTFGKKLQQQLKDPHAHPTSTYREQDQMMKLLVDPTRRLEGLVF